MTQQPPKDWFLPAIETDGSVADCLSAVQHELDSRSCLIVSLRQQLGGRSGTDAVTALSLRLKTIENTFRFRLGILRAERPGAWFRPPAATTSGPFSSSIVAEPVFAMYDVKKVDEVKDQLKKCWQTGTAKSLPFENDDPCLWRSLLQINADWESLCVLPVPHQELRLNRLPDGLPPFAESTALRAFLLNVRTELLSIRKRLDDGFEQLWTASERLWDYQRKRLQDTSRTSRPTHPTAEQVRDEFRRRRRTTQPLRSGLDSESLHCMGFSEFPSADDLRRRYRELAKKWHPDLKAGNEEEFKRLNRAYRHLNTRLGTCLP